jgi:hypothetical protein
MMTMANMVAGFAIAAVLAPVLGACGYRELKAPCGPDEGSPPALSYAQLAATPLTGSPLDRLSGGSIAVTDPCGPLQPINGSRSNSGPPP